MSWVIVSKATGKAVFETFNRRTADAINTEHYEVLPALQYLGKLNQAIREGQGQ